MVVTTEASLYAFLQSQTECFSPEYFIYDLSMETLKIIIEVDRMIIIRILGRQKSNVSWIKWKHREAAQHGLIRNYFWKYSYRINGFTQEQQKRTFFFSDPKHEGSRQLTCKFYSKNFMVSKLWLDCIISLPILYCMCYKLSSKTEINNRATNLCKSSF